MTFSPIYDNLWCLDTSIGQFVSIWIPVLSMVGWHPMMTLCQMPIRLFYEAISMAKKRDEFSPDSQGMEWDIQVWDIIKWIYIYSVLYMYIWVWFNTIGPEIGESWMDFVTNKFCWFVSPHWSPSPSGGSAKLPERLQRAGPRGLSWSKD